jgi:hypothetical protein
VKILRMFQSHGGSDKPRDVRDLSALLKEFAQLDSEAIIKAAQIEARHFQFAVILVDETNLEEIPAIIKRVVRTTLQHGALPSSITSSLLVGVLGVPSPRGNSPELRRGLVSALLRENGDRVRIAHGECDGSLGLLGAEGRFTYGEIIPGFSRILRVLLETKFGTAVEIDS